MADGQLATPISPGGTDDRLDCLRLVRSRRVGAVTWHRLMAEHGSARAALSALPGIAAAAGVDRYEACPVGVAEAEIRQGLALGARLLVHGQEAYPRALMDLPDAPPVLWVLGDETLLNRPAVALVGARNASSLGVRMGRRLGQGLTEAEFVVVSGLARGIDAAAHTGALDAGGITLAAVAGGLDRPYPPEHAALQARIAEAGVVLAEAPLGTEPQGRHFPRRNRIIAALSLGVVVVEAAPKSGSLLTARLALEQGRELFAVPGSPLDPRARGANDLIRQGAHLTESAEDILANLPDSPRREGLSRLPIFARGPAPALAEEPAEALADPEETESARSQVLELLGPSPVPVDDLLRRSALSAAALAEVLLELDLAGRLERLPGNRVALIA